MRLEVVENWVQRERHKTQRGAFVGVAIGPDSDDGVVLVNGVTLQAGRVLPLSSDGDGYTITRRTGRRADSLDSAVSDQLAIRRLELMLFEHFEELATEVARPCGEYSTAPGSESDLMTSPGTGEGDDSAEARILTFPFVGRRQAQLRIHAVYIGGTWGYRVLGRKWSASQRAVHEVELRSVSGLDTTSETINIGGDNEAEAYHEIALYAFCEDGPAAAVCQAVITCDATTIGEIGAR